MVRNVDVELLTKNIKEMCIKANHYLAPDMEKAMREACEKESKPLAKQILGQLLENLDIAGKDMIPICQDTGMAVVFLKIGQDVHFEGGSVEKAVNEGVRQGYQEGYLRKSVVGDPLLRVNTKDNTPAVIHYELVPGDQVEITLAPKGFGSENMSKIWMLKPADGAEGVKEAIIETVREAGPNACPPVVVGVGIGGTFEKAAILAKQALTREIGTHSPLAHIREMEEELLQKINEIGLGPAGLGGDTTALAVNINTYATHIAGTSSGSKYVLSCKPSYCTDNIEGEKPEFSGGRKMDRYMNAPLDREEVKTLRAGDYVYITGTIYTARDAAHLRMSQTLDRGEELPIKLEGNVIYYMGPYPGQTGKNYRLRRSYYRQPYG